MNPLAELATAWPQLNRLLDEALALPAPERGPWLAALGAEHAPLKDTLARLLDVRNGIETGDFMGTLPKLAPSPEGTPEGAPAEGDEVGPWRLLRELGQGGMGSVWLAERADGQLKRPVALKLPRLAWARGLAERMARERDILATLEHPNIARLYDAGVDQLGRPWLALEAVQGQPIDAYVRQQALDVRQRVKLLLQVCAAVAYAHSRLVIHRDLKPSNILVTDEGQVKLLDFGIAKIVHDDQAVATALTEMAGRALTLDYASPEQVKGQALTTASDVYSLGVVAYELLAGARPYRLARGSAAELEEAIAAIDAPAASAACTDDAARAQLRGDLDAVLNKALKKSPADRYGTVEALAADLRGHLAGQAVSARPDSALYRLRRWVGRHRLESAIAVAVLLALLAGAYAQVAVAVALGLGTAVALWQRNQALRSARQAQAQAAQAREQTRAAELAGSREEQIKILYVEVLASLATWTAEQFQAPLAVSRLVQQKLREVEQHPSTPPENVLAVQQAVMVQLPFMGDYEGALAVGQRHLASLRAGGGSRARQQIAYLGNGRALLALGRLDEAVAHLREALRIEPDHDDARRNVARLRNELARVLQRMGRLKDALAALAPALAEVRRQPELYERRHEVLQTQGRLLQGLDDVQAHRFLDEAYAAYQQAMAPQQAETGVCLMFLGQSRLAVGQWDAAERELRAALAALDGIYGPADRDSVLALTWLVAAVGAQGRFAEARHLLDERQALVQAAQGPDTAVALASLAARRLDLEVTHGDLEAAAEAGAMLDAFDLGAPGMRNVDLVAPARARLRLLSDRCDEARALIEARLSELERAPDWTPETARLRLLRAAADAQQGRGEDALAALAELLAVLQADAATQTATHAEAVALRAALLAETGQAAEAAQALAADAARREAAGLGAPSIVWRAEQQRLAAAVQRHAGAESAAQALAQQAAAGLSTQHPLSPRRRERA
jgi:eukaryotic-like serine/threonine-protein kinase